MDPLNNVVHLAPAAIVERDIARQDQVLEQVRQLSNSITYSTFDLAAHLAEIKQNDYWAKEAESFQEWVKKKSGLDISPRQSYYLIDIHNVSTALGITRPELAAAKVSKLKEIFQLDPKAIVVDEATQKQESMADIIKQLVKEAPTKTLAEIKEIVKRLLGKVDGPDSELTWMNLPVRRDAKNVVLRAIDLAKLLSGDTIDAVTEEVRDISNATALERICADFLSDENNQLDEIGAPGDYEDEINEESDSFEDEIDEVQYDDEAEEL